MKTKKTAAVALAAIMAVGSMSAVSYAETAEIREDRKYEITLEKEIVDGEEKAVVAFSGLPKEALTFDYSHEDQSSYGSETIGVCNFNKLSGIRIIIGNEESSWDYIYRDFNLNDEYEWSAGTVAEMADWNIINPNSDYYTPTYTVTVEKEKTTLTLKAYFDSDDAKIKSLESKEEITVCTYAILYGSGSTCRDTNGDGQITGDEYGNWFSVGDALDYVPIASGKKMALNCDIETRADLPKERVKITNNLNTPETSEPTTSEPTTSDTSTVTPGDSDKQEILEATLKNVDSEKGIEGAKLDELLFGESGWTWDQVEKIEFTSEKLFSVLYKDDSGNWVPLGETVSVRAASDDVWDTAWTLFSSAMGKTKYAKVIAKEGTTDVKATIYLKKGAEKPDGTDQKPTGITLAIAPVVLAAGAAIVILKKRK